MRTDWASLDDLNGEIRECARQSQEFRAVEKLLRKLVTLQDRARAPEGQVPGNDEVESALRRGLSLLVGLHLEENDFRRHLGAVLSLLGENDGQAIPSKEEIEEYVVSHRGEIMERLPKDPGGLAAHLCKETGLSCDVAQFILWAAFHPFFRYRAQAILGDRDTHLWSGAFCPVCGARPHMAKLREKDGARVMECWLCATQWRYPRIKCPFCHTEDQQHLGFFHLEGEEGLRIQVCDACKKYLKVVDTRAFKRGVVLSVQNLATLHCDAVAEGEGYRPGSGLRLVPETREDVAEMTERGENR